MSSDRRFPAVQISYMAVKRVLQSVGVFSLLGAVMM